MLVGVVVVVGVKLQSCYVIKFRCVFFGRSLVIRNTDTV